MKRLVLITGVCSMLLLWSCNSGHRHETHHEQEMHAAEAAHGHGKEDPHDHGALHGHEETGAAGHSDEIVIAPEKAEAAGITAEKIEPSAFSGVIRTGGQVLPAKGDERTLVATADGIVSFSGNYFEGAAVKEGQPMFSLISGTIQDGNRIGKAKVAYESAKAEYERASALVDSKIVSRKEFESIEAAYLTAKLRYEAIAGDGKGDGAAVRCPSDGFVSKCLVNAGDYVSVGQPLAVVSSNDRLYLAADVSERYAARIPGICDANFRLQYGDRVYSASGLGGRLVSYGRNTGEASPFIPVTFVLNRTEDIIPGSYAEIWLMGEERDNVISLPVSALTEEQGVYFVYVRLDEDCYRKQPVTVGATDGLRAEILSGLEGGEMVVVEGAIHVRLASASNAIPAHTHNH